MLGFIYTKSNRTLAKKEEQLAWVLLFPTVLIIFSIVILPLISIFWISFKPISLSDLRPPKPIIKERVKGKLEKAGDKGEIHYRIRNSSRDQIINNVKLVDSEIQKSNLGVNPQAVSYTHLTLPTILLV